MVEGVVWSDVVYKDTAEGSLLMEMRLRLCKIDTLFAFKMNVENSLMRFKSKDLARIPAAVPMVSIPSAAGIWLFAILRNRSKASRS